MRRWIVVSNVCLVSATLLCTSGCVATRSWVREALAPVTGRLIAVDNRVDVVDQRVDQVDARTAQALTALQNLRLEKKLVLGLKEGATFGLNSAGLTRRAKGEIDRFLKEYEERTDSGATAPDRLFVVAGHTDITGKADYNYELAQRRAERVAGYLVSEKGVDPLNVHVVSYGAAKPVANNKRLAGRRENRRIEILVYQEKVSANTATH